MKITVSVIKADVGSVGGHNRPSEKLLASLHNHLKQNAQRLLKDFKVTFTGDDGCLLMSHTKGVDHPEIHKLAWEAFIEATKVAKEQGLYGAGQDLLKDAFSGNVRGMGPGSCEMEFEERPSEPLVLFACDKTDPGAFNYPMFRGFADPFHNAGLLLAPDMAVGFEYTIMDVNYTEGDRVIGLNGPAIVTALGLCIHNGIFTEGVDLFDQPFWDHIRNKAAEKTMHIRDQGFFGAAMATMEELEYTGVVERIKALDKKFKIRK